MQFIVLSSSRGTAFQSVIDAMNHGRLEATCLGLITDREDRGCIDKAKAAGLPYRVVKRTRNGDREAEDRELQQIIEEMIKGDTSSPAGVTLSGAHSETECVDEVSTPACAQHDTVYLACMGWMWIFSPWFMEKWPNKILNVHPALLPRFGGKGMYGHHVHEAVLKSGEAESGMTVHFMDTGVDTGPIVLQKRCPVMKDDTLESLQARVQELEKEGYVEALKSLT